MELNKEQQQAVKHQSGPLLIVAGAGTGKTLVITERIKWLLEQKLAKPEEILALTFTEKAAKEMEERVDQALPYGTFGMWINTFHSFCDRVLKSEALQIGLNPHYKLLTEAETYLLVKKNFWKFKLEHFRPHGNPYKFIDGMIQHFSRIKDEDVGAAQYLEFAKKPISQEELRIMNYELCKEEKNKFLELAEAYKTYEDLKVAEGVMDFADLITNALKLFRTRKNVLARYQKQFKYILVDEFQDTNYAQYQLVKLLAADDSNLTVVGDDSQSIYKFRGAAISNILTFMKDYPKAKQILLTKNYRSTQTILDAAYKLIKHNDPDTLEAKLGINKNLVSQVKDGEKIELIRTERVEQEAEGVVTKINQLHSNPINKYDWRDFAILVRANNHSEPFVRALERARIPYQFLGLGRLFHQPEVKDLIAYLKFLTDFTDTVSLYRVLSMDIFSIKQRDLIEWLNRAKRKNISLFEELEQCNNLTIEQFIKMVHRHQELIKKETGGQILFYFLEDSGLLKNITNWEEKRAQNIAKFFDKVKTFEMGSKEPSVFNLVEYLNLAMDLGESPLAAETDWGQTNAVNILTLHSAKGLEFPIVFLVNLVEGRFPTYERKEQIPIPDKLIKETLPVGDYHLEEERRLFYVGMTRAKEKLFFSAASFYGEGKRERKISPFVLEAIGKQDDRMTANNQKQIPLFEWKKQREELRIMNYELCKVDYLSYSAIQAFKDCPLHYKLRYILRIPTPTTAPLSFGSSIHAALNEFYLTKTEIFAALKNNWIIEGYTSKKHEQESLEKAQKFLQEYLKTGLHQKAKPIYLEMPFTFKISGHSGGRPKGEPIESQKRSYQSLHSFQDDEGVLKIGGKLDRVDELPNGEIEIIDYKTGANVPSQKDIDLDLQMTIYALAATEVLQKSIDKVKLSFYFFDNQTKISTTRTKEQLENAKKELLAIREEIQKSDFACSGSKHCEKCEFEILCG